MQFRLFGPIGLLLASIAASAESLQAVYLQAKNADPVWLGAQAANRAAQESTNQSFANFLPSANLSASTASNFENIESVNRFIPNRREKFNSNSWTLNITQPVFRIKNYAAHRQAKASVRRADIQLAAEAQSLILRVAQAYFDVLSADTELTSVRAEKKAIARQLEQAQKRFEVGLIAITSVHEAQASYDLAVANEIAAENRRLLAGVTLSEITGETHGELSDLRDTIELVVPDPPDIGKWVRQATENNLSLSAAVAAVEAAQENVKIRRADHYPTVDLRATRNSSTSSSGFGREADSEAIILEFNLPIYAGGSVSSLTRQSLAMLAETRQELTQTKRAVEKLARDAYLGVISDISRIRALEQAVISAQSAVDATTAGFEVGTRTIVDVLNAQRTLFRSSSDYQVARYGYLLNGLKLKQAVGSLSNEDMASINQRLQPP